MIDAADRRLILLLGSSRSGTTWLAAILNSYPEVIYSHEPLSRLQAPELDRLIEKIKTSGDLLLDERRQLVLEWCAANHACRRPPFFAKSFNRIPAWLPLISWVLVRTSGLGQGLFRRVFSPGQRRPFDVLIKEIEWSKHTGMLVQALDPKLLIVIRHPCGMAASLLRGQRLGLMPMHDLATWFDDHQEACLEVGFSADDIRGMEPCEFLGLQWLVHNLLYQKAMQSHPDSHLVVYEELCRDPVRVTNAVFAYLGWQVGPQTLRFIERSSKEKNIWLLDWLQAKHPYFGVRKDSIQSAESWRSELTEKQQEQVLSIATLLPGFEQFWPHPERSGAQSAEITSGRSKNRYQEGARNGKPLATGAKQDIPAELSVPLILENMPPATGCQPFSVGLPFPKGVLRRTHFLRLADSAGQLLPLQARVLGQWSDGSIRWALLDFVAHQTQNSRGNLVLDTNAFPARLTDVPRLDIRQTPGTVIINTGAAIFHVGKENLPFCRVLLGDKEVLNLSSSRIVLSDMNGRPVPFQVDEVNLEDRGPIRATVLITGIARRSGLRFYLRLCFFAGTTLARLRFTLHNPRRARHKDGLWDLGDPGSVLFKDLALELELAGIVKPEIGWSIQPGTTAHFTTEPSLEIYQDSSGGENWRCKNHVNRHGHVPTSFRGYRVRAGQTESCGLRASPVVGLAGSLGSIAVAVPEFWQQFPKAISVDNRLLTIGLFPNQFSDLYELQGGEQKTHTLWLEFFPGNSLCMDSLSWVHQPGRVHAAPTWYIESGVISCVTNSQSASENRLEAYLKEVIQGERSFFARREIIDEYGWRNFGDMFADHELAYFRGELPLVSHYNNQYDFLLGTLLQYLRSGDTRWFDLADALARHVIDIDIYHTREDRAAYSGGLFWHTDHYLDAATSTHRAFSRMNCRHSPQAYGGGPSNEHNFTSGLLHYYYLTGDRKARDAVISLANWVIDRDDGSRSQFRLVDDSPTGLASNTAEARYHGPGRGSGNSINALLDAWVASGQKLYLDKAEGLIRRVVHPHDDVNARDLLNVEFRWSYTVFLSVLARYLHLKKEAGAFDYMFAYAQASLVTYAKWMLDNELAYFDQREKLQYPTETWAAQELRKANVFRLAAAHADEPLRSKLLQRGAEFAERSWTDLLRFESRYAARSVAIVMTEGALDCYFTQTRLVPHAHPDGVYDFGKPESFVPQKDRVLKLLRTPRGLSRALLRLANPRNWWRALSWHEV